MTSSSPTRRGGAAEFAPTPRQTWSLHGGPRADGARRHRSQAGLAQQHGEWSMSMLLIDYRVQDVVGWRAIFDQDPMRRAQHGVTRHPIYQDCEDPNHLMLSLEFPPPRR